MPTPAYDDNHDGRETADSVGRSAYKDSSVPADHGDLHSFEMDDSQTLMTAESIGSTGQSQQNLKNGSTQATGLAGVARHTLGLILLLCVVFLWTLSNFLGSSIFADDSYAKPFFLTYLNTSCFMLCILPRLGSSAYRESRQGTLKETLKRTMTVQTLRAFWNGEAKEYAMVDEEESFIKPATATDSSGPEKRLGMIATARLSLSFCILWFGANYFAMACLQYTTVASTTILTSTSSIWTLLIGALTRTEKFTWKKLCGVLASLAGIVLISQVDLKSGSDDTVNTNRILRRALDDFPDKTPFELALGDGLALLSAVLYGFYTIILKRTTVSVLPREIHMPTFFGFVGIFNIVLLLPLFPILHFTGLESFQFPPSLHIWVILLSNSVSSLVSDICWAYAMVFTSPLVVTVGLSLTIPLSLIGEMLIQGRFESWIYWVGAMIVVGSFVFVEREEKHEENGEIDQDDVGEPGPAIIVEDYDETRDGLINEGDRRY